MYSWLMEMFGIVVTGVAAGCAIVVMVMVKILGGSFTSQIQTNTLLLICITASVASTIIFIPILTLTTTLFWKILTSWVHS